MHQHSAKHSNPQVQQPHTALDSFPVPPVLKIFKWKHERNSRDNNAELSIFYDITAMTVSEILISMIKWQHSCCGQIKKNTHCFFLQGPPSLNTSLFNLELLQKYNLLVCDTTYFGRQDMQSAIFYALRLNNKYNGSLSDKNRWTFTKTNW